MGVKCNIVSQALNKLYELQFSSSCSSKDNFIIENYIKNLNCSGLDFVPCGPNDSKTNCSNAVDIFKCSFKATKITIISRNDTSVIFGVELVSGKAPYVYSWGADTNDLVPAGASNGEQYTVTAKPGKQLNLIVSNVGVVVKDADGCSSNKYCTLTPTGMKCGTNYQSCPNISDLTVYSIITYCASPHNLVVVKI